MSCSVFRGPGRREGRGVVLFCVRLFLDDSVGVNSPHDYVDCELAQSKGPCDWLIDRSIASSRFLRYVRTFAALAARVLLPDVYVMGTYKIYMNDTHLLSVL